VTWQRSWGISEGFRHVFFGARTGTAPETRGNQGDFSEFTTKKWAISLMKNGFEDALTTRKLKQPDVVNVDMRMTKDQVFWDRNAPTIRNWDSADLIVTNGAFFSEETCVFNQEECVLLPTSDVDLTTENWDVSFIYPLVILRSYGKNGPFIDDQNEDLP
jgi:hypothetical protein